MIAGGGDRAQLRRRQLDIHRVTAERRNRYSDDHRRCSRFAATCVDPSYSLARGRERGAAVSRSSARTDRRSLYPNVDGKIVLGMRAARRRGVRHETRRSSRCPSFDGCTRSDDRNTRRPSSCPGSGIAGQSGNRGPRRCWTLGTASRLCQVRGMWSRSLPIRHRGRRPRRWRTHGRMGSLPVDRDCRSPRRSIRDRRFVCHLEDDRLVVLEVTELWLFLCEAPTFEMGTLRDAHGMCFAGSP